MDQFEKPTLNTKEEKIRQKIQEQIQYCITCQPYDEGEPVWIHGDRVELLDLFCDEELPEDSEERIIANLNCPFCGNEFLEAGSDVGVATQYDKELDVAYEKALKIYGKEVKQLEKLLEEYPLLAYKDKFAKKIFSEIKDGKFPTTQANGTFYRCREVSSSDVLEENEFMHPPIGKSREGRFNHSGQSHWYLANTLKTAIEEVLRDKKKGLVWCHEIKIKKEVERILDLSFDWANISPSASILLFSLHVKNSVVKSNRNKENWCPDYVLTRYIMDCAKNLGYNGIKYNSSQLRNSFNLVLFYPSKIDKESMGHPSVKVMLTPDDDDMFDSAILDE